MKPWQREARLAGRWKFRATFTGGWGLQICINNYQIHHRSAKAMAWLSVFG